MHIRPSTFDLDEHLHIHEALKSCPPEQHDQIMTILALYRFHATILESILDGYTRIDGLNQDGLLLSLTPEGRHYVRETLLHEN